jgi:hypothetical protein
VDGDRDPARSEGFAGAELGDINALDNINVSRCIKKAMYDTLAWHARKLVGLYVVS